MSRSSRCYLHILLLSSRERSVGAAAIYYLNREKPLLPSISTRGEEERRTISEEKKNTLFLSIRRTREGVAAAISGGSSSISE